MAHSSILPEAAPVGDPTLRGTIVVLAAMFIALSALFAQASIAILAKPLGGFANVAGWLAFLTSPSVPIWGLLHRRDQGPPGLRRNLNKIPNRLRKVTRFSR